MDDIATRRIARQILGQLGPSAWKSLGWLLLCLVLALVAAFVPEYEGLSEPGTQALFILLFCAGLWVTEAIPAFAVSLLAISLAITLLGKPRNGSADWEKYVATWGSPLIWLFFGGFILAAAAKKTGLDLWITSHVLSRLGKKPGVVLLGIMGSTAMLSMFLSNTATATMMVAMLGPMLATSGNSKALLLGVAMAANVGGMGTIIGTPPNAIAAGTLASLGGINFTRWMLFGVPPTIILLVIAWVYLTFFYLGRKAFSPAEDMALGTVTMPPAVPRIQQALVIVTFAVTVLMWMCSPWHGIPTTVVSFIPICVLTATKTLEAEDLREISWDVLLLIAGGLSLGVAIRDTGLAEWIVTKLPLQGLGPIAVALCLAYLATMLSNLMSNTAAANVILPIALALLGTEHAMMIVPIALAASAAMCLPVSTPPNAIVYGTGMLKTTDLLGAGVVLGLITPPVVVGWSVIMTAF